MAELTKDIEMDPVMDEAKKPEDILGNGGIVKEILKEGTGWQKPKPGADVRVHYVGRLLDGTQFDSSRDRNEEFSFKLGKGQVIKGWDEGVATMKKGELAKLTIKPEYAYGAQGSPPKIPPNSTLEFEVELISWTDETNVTKDGGVVKKVVKEGEGWERPKDGSKVKVHLVTRLFGEGDQVQLDREFVPSDLRLLEEKNDFTFVVGEEQVIEGLDKAVADMKKGEVAEVKVRPAYGYGSKGNPELSIPPNATLWMQITLAEFEKEKESWDMDTAEKLAAAATKREQGNDFFRTGRISLAAKRYKRSLDYIQYDSGFTDEEKEKSKALKLPLYLNLAACQLKLNELKDVITNTDKALEIDSRNVKALFRRGKARMLLGDWLEAKRDLNKALEIDPKNAEVKAELVALREKERAQAQKEKRMFSRMFEKLSKLEEEEAKENKVEEQPPATTTTTTTETKATTPSPEAVPEKEAGDSATTPMEVETRV